MTATHSPSTRPLVFIILDGWGYNPDAAHNAIATAKTPHWDQLLANYPHRLISGSGIDVGLPEGQMGNSEVGHMHIGAGRIVYQDLTRISLSIANGEFQHNPVFTHALEDCQQGKRRLHILGLLSPGGVHSHETHIQALVKMAGAYPNVDVFIHAFLDGRDCPPQSAAESINALEACIKPFPHIKIASICGRYFAMDRDKRYDRTQQAYDAITAGIAPMHAKSAAAGLVQAYARQENDEFVQPTLIEGVDAKFHDNDAVIFMNFRADRARQLTRALTDPAFQGFLRTHFTPLSHCITLTEYDPTLNCEVAFPPQPLTDMLGEVLAREHCKQYRVAETEKYAHVTFFLNGGREQAFPGEDRMLIPSNRDVATYDLKPEMGAFEITDAITRAIREQRYDIIIANYANPDMVGHTGNFQATVKAIEIIDSCLGQIIDAIQQRGGELLITSDHGNAEYMFDPATQQAHTAHTNLPVPLVYMGRPAQFDNQPANLADLAPTLLSLMGIAVPRVMTGRNLLTLGSA